MADNCSNKVLITIAEWKKQMSNIVYEETQRFLRAQQKSTSLATINDSNGHYFREKDDTYNGAVK